MEFDPAFALLKKFSAGLRTDPADEHDVAVVAKYLGVTLPNRSLDDRIKMLSDELSSQEGLLSSQLESDAIYLSEAYRRSMFIRDVVANNRINRQKTVDRWRDQEGRVSRIVLKPAAVDKLLESLSDRRSTNAPESKVPVLYYGRRPLPLDDAPMIEGEGVFALSFIDPADIGAAGDIQYRGVSVGGRRSILVAGPESILSSSFRVGFSDGRFTLDRPDATDS